MGHFSLLLYINFLRVSKGLAHFFLLPTRSWEIFFASVFAAPMFFETELITYTPVREQRCDKIKEMKLGVIFLILIPGITFKECLLLSQGKFFFPWTTTVLVKCFRKHGILFVKITKSIHLLRVSYIE